MATKSGRQTTFEAQNVIQPIHTGGSVALDKSGSCLATCLGEDALLTDLGSGKQLARLEGDGELISTLALAPSSSHLIICSRSLSMRIYTVTTLPTTSLTVSCELTRTVKPHTTPVVAIAVDETSTLLATGAADGVVKIWDIRGGFVTHTFRGPNILITALRFFELPSVREDRDDISRFRLATGSQDGKVRVWDLKKKQSKILDSHVSDVRALDFSASENALMTASRDKTIMWWDAKTWKVRKVVPVLEEIEAAGFLNNGEITYSGGANGKIRLWRTQTGQELTPPQSPAQENERIVDAVHHPGLSFMLTVNADHVLILKSTDPSTLPLLDLKRISGTHDEIIDLSYVTPDRSLLALATNSEEIRIVSLSTTDSYFGADVAQLTGHEDIIICLDVDWSGHWIATGAKDNTARLWRIDAETNSFTCFATFTGHAESLGAIAFPRSPPQEDTPSFKAPLDHPPPYLLTGSQDRTIKRWEVPRTSSVKAPRAFYTRKAHDKDINAIDINHNGQLFASASQDRTVKIWSVEEGEVQGVLRGHRRGVWSVRFAPKNTPSVVGDTGQSAGKGLVITGSGDKTLKLWSLSDYSCLRTFEGHTNSVLKVIWLAPTERKRAQIATAGGDGLVKVWDASTGEVECTLDNHEDRVWALAVHPTTNTIVSGSGDSTVTFWTDTTASTAAATVAAATQFVEQEQELQNHIHAGSYREAITLALQLNHPARLLSLFSSVISNSESGSLSGVLAVDHVLANLHDDQLFTLLLRIRDWNTNSRTAPVAQKLLWTLVKSYPASKFANLKSRRTQPLKEVLDALEAYTERHYRRMEDLVDESYLVEYTLQEMDGIRG